MLAIPIYILYRHARQLVGLSCTIAHQTTFF
uniref:Uncharacterized protein n=1 Tax=Anguilla anguilla TaxID=7936 RepID=A0A0E9TS39_ANGAN